MLATLMVMIDPNFKTNHLDFEFQRLGGRVKSVADTTDKYDGKEVRLVVSEMPSENIGKLRTLNWVYEWNRFK